MILAVRHTGIVVGDMDKNLIFWRDIMGLVVVADFWEEGAFIDRLQHLNGVRLHMIKLAAPDGVIIELLHDESHDRGENIKTEMCDAGIRHIAFTVENADGSWNKLRRNGYETVSEPLISPDCRAKVFFARDPERNLIELVQVL